MLGFFVWDPSPNILVIPFLGLPLTWYGLLFASGFFLGFHLFCYLGKKEFSKVYAESLLVYIMVGTVVGARLAHLLFYHPFSFILNDPLVIFRTWEGGLASHGGVSGVVIALYLFYRKYGKSHPKVSFFRLIDLLSIPTIMVGSLIRIGNFFNQEICGMPTDMPWGVIFLHPADGALAIPRHPVQLYESIFYALIFLSSLVLWKKNIKGIAGYCITMAFTFRFFIERYKGELSPLLSEEHTLFMAQYLSIPMIGFGLLLFYSSRRLVKSR